MESPFFTFLELAAPTVMTLITVFTNLVLSTGGLLVLITIALLAALGLAAAAKQVRRKRRGRRLLAAAAGLLLITLTAIVAADRFFFEPVVGWMFGQAEKRTGLELSFDRARGSLLAGRFELAGLRVGHQAVSRETFDLAIERAEIDLAMPELIKGNLGFGRRQGPPSDGGLMKPERAFVLSGLNLAGVKLTWAGPSVLKPLAAEFSLDYLRATSVSGDYFIRDLLFRGNAAGTLNGQKFSLVNQDRPDGRFESVWRADNLPVEGLAGLIGGPLAWVESGLVDVVVDNQGRRTGEAEILMNWRLAGRGLKMKPSEEISLAARVGAAPFAAYLNNNDGNFDLTVPVRLGPDGIRYAGTDELSTLIWERMRGGVKEFWANQAGQLKRLPEKLLDRAKPEEREPEAGADKPGRRRSFFQRKTDGQSPAAE